MLYEYNRYGEHSHPTFRNRRLYSANGQWFFDTREGQQAGPYRDKYEAEKALAIFVAKNVMVQSASRPDTNSVHYGTQDGIEHMVEEVLAFFTQGKKQGQNAALAWATHRLKRINDNQAVIANSQERIAVIKYAMDQD